MFCKHQYHGIQFHSKINNSERWIQTVVSKHCDRLWITIGTQRYVIVCLRRKLLSNLISFSFWEIPMDAFVCKHRTLGVWGHVNVGFLSISSLSLDAGIIPCGGSNHDLWPFNLCSLTRYGVPESYIFPYGLRWEWVSQSIDEFGSHMQLWLELKLRDNMIILTLTLKPHTFRFTGLVQKLMQMPALWQWKWMRSFSAGITFCLLALLDCLERCHLHHKITLGVSNRWNGMWNGMVEWKMEWNGECS